MLTVVNKDSISLTYIPMENKVTDALGVFTILGHESSFPTALENPQ